MRSIPLGAKGEFTLTVGPEHLASQVKDPLLPPVLATPVMIMMMENAALNAVRPFFEPGESAVGTRVDVRHLAATPVGHRVRAEAELVEAEGRRLVFKVTARDQDEEIGSGVHERMVINLARFGERLAAKVKG